MGEGNTPLIPSSRTGDSLFFKLEITNPTGSYKDRFIAAELTQVIAAGRKICVATSSGNTGSSLAAYCARFGLRCVIVVNADAPAGKLLQMQAHGATVIRVPHFVTAPEVTQSVFAQLQEFTRAAQASLVVSAFRYCPEGMAGVRSIAAETAVRLPDVEHVFVPVGGGGLYVAIAEEMQALRPNVRVHAVQPEGCPTLLRAYRSGADEVEAVTSDTQISGLSVPFDIDASRALHVLRNTGARAIGVTDAEVFTSQRELLLSEGIYSEPAGATALAGYRRAVAEGLIPSSAKAVCIVTGHGFKDPASTGRIAEETAGFTVESSGLLHTLREVAA